MSALPSPVPLPSRHRRGLVALLAVALAAAMLVLPRSTAEASPDADGCAALAALDLPEVIAQSSELVTSGTAAGQSGLPVFCRVRLTVGEAVNIEVWLPTDTYNGRLQSVGGGGYAGSISYSALARAVRDGYASASTDTGHTSPGGSFGLESPGNLDDQAIEDFASRSLVEMTRKAQALVPAFYGSDAEYSYWNGCSTGGRQGLMLVQRLPDAYDGVLAAAPAINWDRFIPAELWPQIVMQDELGGPIASCKLGVGTAAAVAACDDLDGVVDGLLEDPRLCDFDAASLVGEQTPCGQFTAADARTLNAIWAGPRAPDGSFRWYGLSRGAPLNFLAGSSPFPIATDHLRYWVNQDPDFDWTTLDPAGYDQDFVESQALFNDVIGTDDPDLAPFRGNGGRLLMWHGWEDQLIFPQGTIDYYDRVVDTLPGGARRIGDFARLFMAPGVYHCGGGPGPNQFDMFGALVDWVEAGDAPERIIASTVADGEVTRTRPLCPYPLVSRYDGRGDVDEAESFDCRPNLRPWSHRRH